MTLVKFRNAYIAIDYEQDALPLLQYFSFPFFPSFLYFLPSSREQYSRTFSFYSVSLCRMQIHLGVVYEANFEDDRHFSKITPRPPINLLLAPVSPSSSRFVFLLFLYVYIYFSGNGDEIEQTRQTEFF